MTMNTRTDHTTHAKPTHSKVMTAGTGGAAPIQHPVVAAKTPEEPGPWKPAFPPPADGKYEVKMGDKIVKVTRRDGTWKLPDGRSVNVSEWR
jgi:hypothetical protein